MVSYVKFLGLGQFGAAVSAASRFGDGGRKCFMRKKCVFLKYFEGWTTKDVCFISVCVVIVMASDQCSFPSSGLWKNLVRP